MIAHAAAVEVAPPGSRTPSSLDPEVLASLGARGVPGRRLADEDPLRHRERIATGLMALFRDDRSEEVFQELYRWTRLEVLHWLRGLVQRYGAPMDPHELLQDTFVNVFQYAGSFRDTHAGSFRVWVRTVAGNVLRRALSRRNRFSLQELPQGLLEPVDGSALPLRRLLDVEEQRRLELSWILLLQHYLRAWEALRERDQRALQLVEVGGLSYAETGARLKVGPSNMKMIMFRSRQRIAHRMRLSMGPARTARSA